MMMILKRDSVVTRASEHGVVIVEVVVASTTKLDLTVYIMHLNNGQVKFESQFSKGPHTGTLSGSSSHSFTHY